MIDLEQAIQQAIKARDPIALTAYRALKAKAMNKLTEAGRGVGKPLTEEEMAALVRREIKERAESNEFLDASRPEYEENAGIIRLLEPYLPQQLSSEALEALIRKTLDEVKPSGPKEMGKVMAALRQVPGVDLAAASARVKELLQST